VEAADEAFWSQFWTETLSSVQDVFTLIPAAEIRSLREESPSNLATLCYKAVEKLVQAAETGCHSHKEEQTGCSSSSNSMPIYCRCEVPTYCALVHGIQLTITQIYKLILIGYRPIIYLMCTFHCIVRCAHAWLS